MYQVKIQKQALISLKNLTSKDVALVSEAIDSIEKNFPNISNTKKVKSKYNIFRKRIGRYRILFTVKKTIIHIWIIEMEKDTQKDYKKWLDYISKHL